MKRSIIALTILVAMATPSVSEAVIIQAGFDLFRTETAQFNFGSGLGMVDFEGVPLGSFDFGAPVL
ncbi:MAG: hypothetical protein V3R99_13635, partial [Thermoguttaceae bacterium]